MDVNIESHDDISEINWEGLSGTKLGNNTRLISSLWDVQPPSGHVHILVDPRTQRTLAGKSNMFYLGAVDLRAFPTGGSSLQAADRVPPIHEDAISFTIPSKSSFLNLKKSDICADEVEDATLGEVPIFIQEFQYALTCQRVVPPNVSHLQLEASFFPQISSFYSHHISEPFLADLPSSIHHSTPIFKFKNQLKIIS